MELLLWAERRKLRRSKILWIAGFATVMVALIVFAQGQIGRASCMEISLLTAFAVLPILAAAAAQKGYILPVCLTLVYTFLGFILLMVNMYLHPLSSMTAIVMRDIPGVVITQPLNIPGAFLCIGVWGVASVLLAGAALKKRK